MQSRHLNHATAASSIPILILEDERFDRHRLARLCSGLDFACHLHNAKTLSDFEVELERDIFGLILLDHNLPDGTGFDALDMVRLSAGNLNAPVLMISGHDAPQLADRAVASGCAGYLSKDALTSTAFQSAVQLALGQWPGPMPTDTQTFTRLQVAGLMARLTTSNARDVKPMVSRLMRQMRALHRPSDEGERAKLDALSQNCMSLWAFLIEMERQDGAALIQDVLDGGGGPAPTAFATKPRKPPSPFSRMQH